MDERQEEEEEEKKVGPGGGASSLTTILTGGGYHREQGGKAKGKGRRKGDLGINCEYKLTILCIHHRYFTHQQPTPYHILSSKLTITEKICLTNN